MGVTGLRGWCWWWSILAERQNCSPVRTKHLFQTSYPLHASLLSLSPSFRYIHTSLCACVRVPVEVMIAEFGAQTMWLYFYGPLSSIRHNGMLSASARLSLLQCFITCVCVFSSHKQCFITYLSQGSLNISSCLITQWGSHYLFQSYLPSRPLPSQRYARTHTHAQTLHCHVCHHQCM